MTKVPVYDLNGKEKGQIELGKAFSKPVRTDIIIKCFLAEQANKRQPYGADPMAGKRTSAHYHGVGGVRGSMKNREMHRTKRIHGQGNLNLTARFVPQAVKGRKAHPPKAEKIWTKKVNKKERLAAILSSISSSVNRDFVMARGHRLNGVKSLPLVVSDDFESLKNTKKVLELLLALGLKNELARTKIKKVRAGKGKTRGRKYKKKKGPLVVINEDKGILKAAGNIAGVDVVKSKDLTLSLLAPGSQPGRLSIYSKGAVEALNKLVR